MSVTDAGPPAFVGGSEAASSSLAPTGASDVHTAHLVPAPLTDADSDFSTR